MLLITWLLVAAIIYQDHTYQKRASLYDKCVSQQIELYGDICAESDGDTKQDGVICAVESINICRGDL